MTIQPQDKIRKVTAELNDELLRERLNLNDEISYQPVPYPDRPGRPTWRIRLELAFKTNQSIGLDVNGEVILGRGEDMLEVIPLFDAEDADHLGVSRQHAALRPTEDKLYIVDLNSTNGTWLNGRSIGVNTPYSLSNGDLITLGRLDVVIKIVNSPESASRPLDADDDLVSILPEVACRITSQLEREQVMKQAMEMVLTYTHANQASVWLVDEQTGELYLEAGMGTDELQVRRLPVTDTLPGHVIETGKPLRANRELNGEQVKIKTGYLVEAVIYVPLTLGGVTFGVLSAVHHEPGKLFSPKEEQLMLTIAQFTAVAIHNARLYKTADSSLAYRTKVMTALNYALSFDMKNRANAIIGYSSMLADDLALDEETRDISQNLAAEGEKMARLIERLLEITSLGEDTAVPHKPCDLIDAVTRAIRDSSGKADAKSIDLDFQIIGDPYIIQGNYTRLYRSTLNLLDNAIKYSPPGAQIMVGLVYWETEIALRVRDYGPGIPEEDLPYLFDRYFRSQPSPDGEISIGLGLELVRATVEAHRGSVQARNAEDGGAEFIIKLPATLRVV